MLKNTLAIATVLVLVACTTNEQGKRVIDYEKVRAAALATCVIAPTAAQIAQLYTDNKDVKTTEQAVALLCAAALPVIVPEK